MRLETERLVLRMPEPGDAGAFMDFLGSERSGFMGGPKPRDLAWRSFAAIAGHWTLRGFGTFIVTRRADGAPVGMAGPWFPEGWPEREIGWSVWLPEAEGHGIAFEAARATLTHVYRDLGWETAVSYIARGNARSIRLAERLGALRDPAARGPGEEDIVYRHPAPALKEAADG